MLTILILKVQTYPSYHTGIGFNSYLLRDGTSLRFKLLESENCGEHCCLWEYFYSCLVRCVLVYSSFAKCCLALAKQNKLLFWIWDWCVLDHSTKVRASEAVQMAQLNTFMSGRLVLDQTNSSTYIFLPKIHKTAYT